MGGQAEWFSWPSILVGFVSAMVALGVYYALNRWRPWAWLWREDWLGRISQMIVASAVAALLFNPLGNLIFTEFLDQQAVNEPDSQHGTHRNDAEEGEQAVDDAGEPPQLALDGENLDGHYSTLPHSDQVQVAVRSSEGSLLLAEAAAMLGRLNARSIEIILGGTIERNGGWTADYLTYSVRGPWISQQPDFVEEENETPPQPGEQRAYRKNDQGEWERTSPINTDLFREPSPVGVE